MLLIKQFTLRLGTVAEFLTLLWRRKLWWLIPLAVAILLMGMLLVFGQASGVAPFIYTLF